MGSGTIAVAALAEEQKFMGLKKMRGITWSPGKESAHLPVVISERESG